MSETTTTPNYSLIKPNVNADDDLWGDHWNSNADTLDSLIHGIDTRAQVTSFNTRTGAVTLQASDVSSLGFATTTANDASYVNVSGDTMNGPLVLSGNAASALQAVPLQQLQASVSQPGNATPVMDSITPTAGTSTLYSRQDHVHPVDTSRYAASNPAGYQTAANVTTALAPYAPLASPAFTGVPTTAATPAPGDSSTKLATTAFVANAMSSAATAVSIGDTPPASPQPGNLWFDSTNVSLLIRYQDPSGPAQWVVANNQNALPDAASDGNIYGRQNGAWAAAAPAAALNNAGRNLIHNATFAVAQRGAGAFSASGYTLDRWQMAFGGGTLSVAQNPANDTIRGQTGDEATQSICSVSVVGTSGAGDFAYLVQKIENVLRLSGKTVTVSFWAAAASGTPKLGVSIDQLFGTGGSPSAGVSGTGQSVTLSTTYQRFSLTFAIASAVGKTLGTNGDHSTQLDLWFSSGANNNTRSGNIGVQTAGFGIWGVQLEIGSTATPLEKIDPGDDLRRCQRFYQVGQLWVYASGTGNGAWGNLQPLTGRMRATPTVSANWTTQTNCTGSLQAQDASAMLAWLSQTAAGAANASGTFTASADL